MRKELAVLAVAGGITLFTGTAFADAVAADNSAKNAVDASNAAMTAGDQSNTPADVTMTADVRKAVVADPNLSTNARNVKIITVDGIITLRGPVKNEFEKENVVAKARKVAGASRVDNQLQITGE